MTSTSERPPRRADGTCRFMLTLCRLAAPVSIGPPQSPQLKAFTFFTSHEREADGSEGWYLHMGYFETLADAERWVEGVRGRFPHAIASIAPTAQFRAPDSAAPAFKDESLTDTQVLKILERRGVSPAQDGRDEQGCDQIELLRPDDTSTRRAVKEAVVQGAPVSFAVQLQWSARPIDLSRVRSLAIFKGYTLYATESRRQDASRHFLRLGFFGDPISAKQFAAQVRANFSAAAVVPVTDQEVAQAREAAADGSSIPYLVQQRTERPTDSSETPGPPPESKPLVNERRTVRRGPETLRQTLQRLAEREMLTDDSLSESGVRHLRVDDVQERTPGRRSH